MDEQPRSNHKLLTALAVLIVIVVIVSYFVATGKDESTESSSNTSSQTATTATKATTLTDGTYSASSSFSTPGGADAIKLSLTIKDGVVTNATATTVTDDNTSRSYDDRFLDAYKEVVVGKKVSDLNLSRVAGASLTTQGFNDALQKIETEAEA